MTELYPVTVTKPNEETDDTEIGIERKVTTVPEVLAILENYEQEAILAAAEILTTLPAPLRLEITGKDNAGKDQEIVVAQGDEERIGAILARNAITRAAFEERKLHQ